MSNVISLRLDDYELFELEKKAKERKVSRSSIIKDAIKKLIKKDKPKNSLVEFSGVLSEKDGDDMLKGIKDAKFSKKIVKL